MRIFTKTEFEKLFSKLSNTPCYFSDVTDSQQSCYKDEAYYTKLKKDIYNRELARKSLLEDKIKNYIFDEYHGQEDYKRLVRGLKCIIDGAEDYKRSDADYFIIVNSSLKPTDKEYEHSFFVFTDVETFLLAQVVGNFKKDKSGSLYRRFRIDDMPRLYENCVSYYGNLMRDSEAENRETYKELQYKLSETNKILSDFDNYFYKEYGHK